MQQILRGDEIAMVFQDPMTAFNPVLTIGDQLVDFQTRMPGSRAEKRKRAVAMLARVGIPDPAMRSRSYPHELSGGMRQRAAIAAALLVNPSLLIADEPTTALDVTMEAQIIHLFRELRRDYGGGILIVTHHLGVVAELCDRVYVMYQGEVVEEGAVDDIFHRPRHPIRAHFSAATRPASINAPIICRSSAMPSVPPSPKVACDDARDRSPGRGREFPQARRLSGLRSSPPYRSR
jgi:ABC-type dipeptide/oligopeptide/nickel transport system ATPase component